MSCAFVQIADVLVVRVSRVQNYRFEFSRLHVFLLVAIVRFQYKQVAQAQCSQRLEFCRSCMIQREGARCIRIFVSVGDRYGTSTVGMAVSNKLKLGFVFARVGKRE